METLAGVLLGAGFVLDHGRSQPGHNRRSADFGHLFIEIDPELFMQIREYPARVAHMIEHAKLRELVSRSLNIVFRIGFLRIGCWRNMERS